MGARGCGRKSFEWEPVMRCALLLFLVLLRPWAPVSAQGKPLEGFDAYVTRSMAAWKVPGLAVAIVRNDSVVLAKGYGVRTLGKPDPVDAHTLFAIGSSSKAFTAMAVAMLVDQGKVKWDDRATNYLPELQLYDPYATRELTVRDLLTHRSGLTAADLILYAEHMTRDSALHQVRYVKPTYSFRSHFGYSNLMYLAAGQLTARVTRASWDDVVRQRIFIPLGMTASNTSVTPLNRLPDVATPHEEVDDTVRAIPYFNIDAIGPAGSINSNALDMAQWVRFQLAGGKVGGKPLISAAAFQETHTPQTVVPLEGFWKLAAEDAHLLNYGMGWFLHDYKGRGVVQHGGNIDGMSALVGMLPEEKTGIVVLSNLGGNDLTYALMYRVFDAYLKQPAKDWSAVFLKASREAQTQAKAERKKTEAQRVPGTSPSLSPEKYAGMYTDTLNGDAVVRREKPGLVLQYGTLVADLAHWQYDTFQATWRQRRLGKSYVTFTLDATGKVDKMNVVDLAEFRRKPEVADTTPGIRLAQAELPRYTGSFASPSLPITAEVQLVDGQLKLTVPGQPVYTLVPVTATRFRLTGDEVQAGFFLEYTIDGGTVQRVTLVQPDPQPALTLVPKRAAGR
jgi:CubicO group peptidase (beta-lactamase class C family)